MHQSITVYTNNTLWYVLNIKFNSDKLLVVLMIKLVLDSRKGKVRLKKYKYIK